MLGQTKFFGLKFDFFLVDLGLCRMIKLVILILAEQVQSSRFLRDSNGFKIQFWVPRCSKFIIFGFDPTLRTLWYCWK